MMSITMEHCIRKEETHETTRRRKTPRWQKDKFATKRDGNGLLVQIKEEVYKILTNKEFTDETDSPFEKVEPHKSLMPSLGQYTVETQLNSQKRG